MELVSKFLSILDGNFDASNVEKAFYETNQLYLSQQDISDETIADFLDASKEFFPLLFLTDDEAYSRLYKHLISVYNSDYFPDCQWKVNVTDMFPKNPE